MQQFFTDPSLIEDGKIYIEGSDLSHMKNVLRMRQGEKVRVSDGAGKRYLCTVKGYNGNRAELQIEETCEEDTELPSRIVLFQGLPKGDKMELIVQKAVELGAVSVVPFAAKRSVAKLDEKKAAKKQARWQSIAKSAAEQSGRGIIPEVGSLLTFGEALKSAQDLDILLVPYELEEGMGRTAEVIGRIRPGQSVGIFIGPEGGFEKEEVDQAVETGAVPVTLGKRILRTETAGMAMLSILMYHLEIGSHNLIVKE
ncbi:MAG TPA: 16S rRNA (uracil(1498)-N(3))-methyltransferase [Candidatus Mediterraneibacter norfolkensis]|nr:16S rRNA (uracil(1498)-N(3))-methyltransferase [Candidatus Mediterraneibacter norfolkensis]